MGSMTHPSPRHIRSESGTSFASFSSKHSLQSFPAEGRVDQRLSRRKSSIKGGRASELAVTAALTEEESSRCPPYLVNQFLRATNGNVNNAIKRLKDTLAWRKREEADSAICQACIAKPNSHWLHTIGHDELGRPLFYSNFTMASSRDLEATKRHMIATFEQAIRSMPATVEQWVWVSDFHGFGMRDCDPRLAKIFLDVSARHYPERLARFFIIGAPSVFSMLWASIRPIVDEVTRDKICFLPYDYDKKGMNGALAKALSQDCRPDLTNWLLKEMQQNRAKKVAKQKVYPYGSTQGFLHPPDPDKHVRLEGHDLRGTDDWLALVQADPFILVPQGR